METTSNVDPNLRCEYALRVALQTMKERCVALQRRLTTMEEENQELRQRFDENTSSTSSRNNASNGKPLTGGAAENLNLRLQVAELSRQKAQLTENISMVSNENRMLWSRLSQIAKEHVNKQMYTDIENDLTTQGEASTNSPRANCSGEAQNLIRSKTFTKHSPNQKLRPKHIPGKLSHDEELSLEEVALNAYEDNYNGAGEELAEVNDAQFRFGFLKVDESSTSDADSNLEAKKCLENLQEIHQEAKQQQHDLNSALAILEARIALQPCPECAEKAKKPEMADKSLETDESLSEPKLSSPHCNIMESNQTPTRINIIQEKINADAVDKTCPMCGKIYDSQISFASFCEHVEMHFLDDAHDLDASVERNFEFISHAVGDF